VSARGEQLRITADGQIADLIAIISALDESTLQLPCPGREKLGDGTIAASVRHTADNYQRISAFVSASTRMSRGHESTQHGGHGETYAAEDIGLETVLEQLEVSRDDLVRRCASANRPQRSNSGARLRMAPARTWPRSLTMSWARPGCRLTWPRARSSSRASVLTSPAYGSTRMPLRPGPPAACAPWAMPWRAHRVRRRALPA
jgi:hypothetical protein